MNRRRALGHLKGLILGTLLFNPYASALEHFNALKLPGEPDPFQKKLIDSNVEYLLAMEDAKTEDPNYWCELKTGKAKTKCNANGGID